MTTVDEQTSRERHRQELAELLRREAAELTDNAGLAEDLALDSLGMMSLFTWLETRGVLIEADRKRPARVGDVLSLLDKNPRLTIRLNGLAAGSSGVADIVMPNLVAPRLDGPALAPVLESPGCLLTPIQADDINFLYSLAVQPETCFRWRYRGEPPPIDRFVQDLWTQVLVQFVARRTADSQPVGHLVAYGADANRRHAHIAAVFQPSYVGTGMAAQTVAVFVRFLFHTYPFVKLYLEVPGFNWDQVSSGEGTLFQVEGVLRDHDYYAGRAWDKHICAIYRSEVK